MQKQILFSSLLFLSTINLAHADCVEADYVTAFSNSDGNAQTQTDDKTGLMWAKCQIGKTGANCENGGATKFTWDNALAKVSTANTENYLGYSDWRLPNVKELYSIVEPKCTGPTINRTAFPNTQGAAHWSSTPIDANQAYIVRFAPGIGDYGAKAGEGGGYFIRLVRDAN